MDEIRPAATVVLVHDGDDGLQTLLLRRNTELEFAAGSWVFPGGRVDDADWHDGDDADAAAVRAAVRETREEADLDISGQDLHHFAHWTTPPENKSKRYATWFFVCPVDRIDPVTVDGGEIMEHLWVTPAEALAKQKALQAKILPPTFVTLTELGQCDNVEQVISMYRERPVARFEPRWSVVEGGICMLYGGDAGYEARDPQALGARNRFWMVDAGWSYEKSYDE